MPKALEERGAPELKQGEQRVPRVDALGLSLNKKNPPELVIEADGTCPTEWSGARLARYIYIRPPDDGIQEYDFIATPPEPPTTQIETPVAASDVIEDIPSWLRGVRVHGETNQKEEKYGNLGGAVEATGESKSLSFDEAFREAVAAIGPKVPHHPDYLLRVIVSEVRGEFGGIQGKSALYVTVRAEA